MILIICIYVVREINDPNFHYYGNALAVLQIQMLCRGKGET